ncbi:MAG: phosphatidylserine decarboxylase family protein, partial [Thermoplasmata archaeon]
DKTYLGYFLTVITIISFITSLFMFYFFRDPDRNIPVGEGLFVSPADGKIILIKDVYENEFLRSNVREISIFMSPLNVHVNRSPCDGKVIEVKYSPGKYMAAYKDDASLKNENITMLLEGNYGRVLVRQVAGFIARRAVCRVKPGDILNRGERYGIIKFSSRLDVFLPKDAVIKVKIGDTVKAGETVIARIKY